MATILAGSDRATALLGLPGWGNCADQDAITKSFHFHDFAQAFAFMTEMALVAQRLNHHPDWSNSYNRVDLTLTTHDVGGITANDIRLAHAAEDAARGRVKATPE